MHNSTVMLNNYLFTIATNCCGEKIRIMIELMKAIFICLLKCVDA